MRHVPTVSPTQPPGHPRGNTARVAGLPETNHAALDPFQVAQITPLWPLAFARRQRPVSQGLADRALRLGGSRRGRPVLVLLRPGGDVPGARAEHPPELVRGPGLRGDDRRDLRELFANHRRFPLRRRRLRRRKQAALARRRRRLRLRAPGRLRPHDHDLRGRRRRRALQPARAPGLHPSLEAALRARRAGGPEPGQPARSQRVGPHLGPDLLHLRRDARRGDHLRDLATHASALSGVAVATGTRSTSSPPRSAGSGCSPCCSRPTAWGPAPTPASRP